MIIDTTELRRIVMNYECVFIRTLSRIADPKQKQKYLDYLKKMSERSLNAIHDIETIWINNK